MMALGCPRFKRIMLWTLIMIIFSCTNDACTAGLLITYVALNLMDGHGQPALLYIVPFTLGKLQQLEKGALHAYIYIIHLCVKTWQKLDFLGDIALKLTSPEICFRSFPLPKSSLRTSDVIPVNLFHGCRHLFDIGKEKR